MPDGMVFILAVCSVVVCAMTFGIVKSASNVRKMRKQPKALGR